MTDENQTPAWLRPVIKMEGGIVDPDHFENWGLSDPKQLKQYRDWKAKFDAEQDKLYGVTK